MGGTAEAALLALTAATGALALLALAACTGAALVALAMVTGAAFEPSPSAEPLVGGIPSWAVGPGLEA